MKPVAADVSPRHLLFPTGFVVAALLAVAPGCSRPTPEVAPPPPDVIATVDGRPLHASRLEEELLRARLSGRNADPDQILERLLQRERLVASALRLDLDQDPEVKRSWETALIAKLKERELEPALVASTNPRPTTPAHANEPASPAPLQKRLAILRLEASARASPEKLARIAARLEEARQLATQLPTNSLGFGPLAMEYSDHDDTRSTGGDLGWLDPVPENYQFDRDILTAGFALQAPGDVSPVVHGKDGLYVVRLVELRRRPSPLQHRGLQPKDGLVADPRRSFEARKEIEAAFQEEARRSIPVIIHTAVVARVVDRWKAKPPPDTTEPSVSAPDLAPLSGRRQ